MTDTSAKLRADLQLVPVPVKDIPETRLVEVEFSGELKLWEALRELAFEFVCKTSENKVKYSRKYYLE